MTKKSVFVILAGLLMATFFIFSPGHSPDEQKKFTIGVVNPNPGTQAIQQGFINSIKESAKENGWEISFKKYEEPKEVESALQQMIDEEVDLIFTVTSPATRKMKEMTMVNKIPGIFAIFNPVKSGIIKSMAHPGDNLTGIQISGSVPKALDWLLTLAPKTEHILVPVKFDTKAAEQSLEILIKTAASVGIKVTVAEVNNEKELTAALGAIPDDVDAIFMIHSMLISSHANQIAVAAISRKIPSGAAIGKSDQGILFSYSPKFDDIGKQAARLALMVLQGDSPADIPAEKANYFIGINLATAHETGIEVNNDILVQCDYLIRKE
jgi:putative tryptophan/tyrosine transport system substrate-binding protein